jgi:hypothetical protein
MSDLGGWWIIIGPMYLGYFLFYIVMPLLVVGYAFWRMLRAESGLVRAGWMIGIIAPFSLTQANIALQSHLQEVRKSSILASVSPLPAYLPRRKLLVHKSIPSGKVGSFAGVPNLELVYVVSEHQKVGEKMKAKVYDLTYAESCRKTDEKKAEGKAVIATTYVNETKWELQADGKYFVIRNPKRPGEAPERAYGMGHTNIRDKLKRIAQQNGKSVQVRCKERSPTATEIWLSSEEAAAIPFHLYFGTSAPTATGSSSNRVVYELRFTDSEGDKLAAFWEQPLSMKSIFPGCMSVIGCIDHTPINSSIDSDDFLFAALK